MPSIERTAYPRFSPIITANELQQSFTPTDAEREFAQASTRTNHHAFCFLVLLKCFQRLHYFPSLKEIPSVIVDHLRSYLELRPDVPLEYESERTLYRHCATIREYLGIDTFYGRQARHIAVQAVYKAAQVMNPPADLINAAIEELINNHYELPAFWTLNRVAQRVHAVVQRRLARQVFSRLTAAQTQQLDRLLVVEFEQRQTEFNRLKKLPQRPSRQHLEDLLDHLDWLKSFGDVDDPLAGIAPTKIRNFAQQANALDAGFAPANRYTLLLCLIHRMRVRTRDDIAEMLLKRMATIHKRAKDELVEIQLDQRQKTEKLIGRLDEIAAIAASDISDLQTGRRVRAVLSADGGVEKLREECAAVQLWQGDNYLPLLRKHFVPLRYVLFRLVRAVEMQSTTQDQALLKTLAVVLAYERKRVDWIAVEDLDLSFASDRWQKLLKDSDGQNDRVNRRQLEVCVFSHVAGELKSGDLSIAGSESFADYRQHLLGWGECEAGLKDFCQHMDLPGTAVEFVKDLKTKLTETAARVDQKYPENGDLTISPSGEPVLKKVTAKEIPESAVTLQANITQKMPTRNLLDILVNIEHWTHFTRHFGPLSGSDPKLERAAERYIQTVFAIGCNLGPNQAARHMAGAVSAHTLSFVNRRHFTVEKLEAAQRELIELYLQLDLPKLWGDGRTVAADGTQYDFYEENLLAGYHFRYRKMGAVAYRHVANNYVAVFCHFIPPGVWEAVYVIEGLMKAGQLSRSFQKYADVF